MPILTDPSLEAFAQHYAINGHVGQATLAAGYSSKRYGHAILVKPGVEERVQEILHQRFSKAGITAERTMKELARIAFFNIGDLYDEHGQLIPPHELPDDTAAAVARIKVELVGEGRGEERTLTVVKDIKMADKMAALNLLARHFKIVGEEGDGVNALASALADRLKSARQRDYANATDARIVDPEALPLPAAPESAGSPSPAPRGLRLEYGLPGDPSNGDDVSTPRLVVPVRRADALHSAIPQARPLAATAGARDEDELW